MAIRKRNNNYWKKRSIERESETTKNSQKYIRRIKSAYISSAKETVNQVKSMYSAYYKKDSGFDKSALDKIANKGDIKRFLADMKRAGLSTYLPKNYKGRMTRAELLNAQIWGNVKELAQKEKTISTNSYRNTYENNYYKTIYDTSKGVNENIAFSTLDQNTVNKVLNTKFLGENYSQRIWHNTDILANNLQTILTQAIATGQSQDKTVRQILERYGTRGSAKQAYYNAQRLIRTETNYFQNQSELDAYKEMGIEKYKYLATLDLRTSEICREMDGKIFNVKDKKQGLNAPPMHPNCRSTTTPYIGKEYEPKTRIARDPQTGKNMTIRNMNYDDWYKIYVDISTKK